MDSDSINSTFSPSVPNCKDFSRKKRRSAKLKQCKLDARREQWLSQSAVKNQGCCKEGMNRGDLKQKVRGETYCSLENSGSGGANGRIETGSAQHESDWESFPSNSPTSSILSGGTASGTSFTNSSSSSTSSGGCCSGSITEEEGDDGCLDDWEAVADALAADEKQEMEGNDNITENLCSGSIPEQGPNPPSALIEEGSDLRISKTNCPEMVQKAMGSSRAWSADDASRPQSLPNLSKQRSFPVTERHFGQRGVPWTRSSAFMAPSSCPICYEDLDFTDSSFLPCLCGFRLCLFCHKRIVEEDGRCPGCRKPYEHSPMEAEARIEGGSLTFRLTRSCSMIARS